MGKTYRSSRDAVAAGSVSGVLEQDTGRVAEGKRPVARAGTAPCRILYLRVYGYACGYIDGPPPHRTRGRLSGPSVGVNTTIGKITNASIPAFFLFSSDSTGPLTACIVNNRAQRLTGTETIFYQWQWCSF